MRCPQKRFFNSNTFGLYELYAWSEKGLIIWRERRVGRVRDRAKPRNAETRVSPGTARNAGRLYKTFRKNRLGTQPNCIDVGVNADYRTRKKKKNGRYEARPWSSFGAARARVCVWGGERVGPTLVSPKLFSTIDFNEFQNNRFGRNGRKTRESAHRNTSDAPPRAVRPRTLPIPERAPPPLRPAATIIGADRFCNCRARTTGIRPRYGHVA